MKEKKFLGISLDVIGFTGSFLCAVHCLALPLLVSFGLLGHLHLHQTPTWEWLLFVALLGVAIASLLSSFRNTHQNLTPVVMGFAGLLLILIGEINHQHVSHFLSGIGGLLLASAHFLNWSLLRKIQST